MLQWAFSGEVPGGLPFSIYIQPGTSGGSHNGCGDTNLQIDAFTTTDSELESYIVVAEADEVFMDSQGIGWDCGRSNGEGLSRILAGNIYPWEVSPPGTGVTFSTAANWLDGNRPDFVSRNDGTDTNSESIGCSVLFLNYLHYQLGFRWPSIVAAGASTLAKTYKNLNAGAEADAFNKFSAVLTRAYPAGAASGLVQDNPFPIGSLLEFYKPPNPAPWQIFDHSAEAGTLIASDPDQAFIMDAVAHVFTRGINGRFLEFIKSANAPWQSVDHTQLTQRTIASVPKTLITDSTLHVFGRDDNGHLLEFYKEPDPAVWQVFDHTTDTGMPIGGDAELLLTGSTLHLFAVGIDGHLLEFFKEPNPAPWQVFDHTLDVGIAVESNPAAFLTGNTAHVLAGGLDGHLLEFYKEPNPAPWQVFDHTLETGRTIIGKPAVLVTDATVHVFARGSDSHFLEFYKEPNPAPWQVFDHTDDTGKLIGWAPAVIQTGASVHVFAAGTDSHLLEFYKEPNPAPWTAFDQTGGTGFIVGGTPNLLMTGPDLHVFSRQG